MFKHELSISFNNDIRVTCRDWFQLSLKEGLTVFRDQVQLTYLGYYQHLRHSLLLSF